MRGLLAEFGIVAPRGVALFKTRWLGLRVDHVEALPPLANQHARIAWAILASDTEYHPA